MKKILESIINFFINLFTYVEPIEEVQPEVEETPEIADKIEIEEVPEVKVEEPKEEVYIMLTNRERQTYFKKLGLYTKEIDNIRGSGQKKAEKIFNTIFFNKYVDTYTEETDKMLRTIYDSYCKNPYMVTSDWQYIKNFKKSEYKCPCKKHCNGFPSEVSMKIVMLNQYIRNRINAPLTLTSGVRCQIHNDNLKGSVKNSKHLSGRATDHWGKGKTANELMKIAKEVPYLNYTYQCGDNEIHVDINL